MANARRRDWRDRDFIEKAKEQDHLPDIGADLNTQPLIPETTEKDPAYNRGFFIGEFSDRSLAQLKSAAYDEMIYQQWHDYQAALNDMGYVQKIPGRPQASYAMQDAFDKVMQMSSLNFPVVVLDIEDTKSFLTYATTYYNASLTETRPDDLYYRDFVWTTGKVMKDWSFLRDLERKRSGSPPTFDPQTQPDTTGSEPTSGHFRDRFVDTTVESYSDTIPCLVIFTRKAINGATIVYEDDVTTPDPTPKLAGEMKNALTVAGYDTVLDNKISTQVIRPDDGWLSLTVQRTKVQPWIDDSIAHIDPPGAGTGDPSDPFGGNGGDPGPVDPADPTIKPPPNGGTGGGTGGGTVPGPSEGAGTRADFDCDVEILHEQEGTNHTFSFADFSLNQDGGWLLTLGLQALIPVNAQTVTADLFTAIATAVEAWRVANNKPPTYQITRVQLCVSFQRMRRVAILIDGQDSFATLDFDRFVGTPLSGYSNPMPRLRVQRSSAGSDKRARGEIERLGDYQFAFSGGEAEAIADVEIAKDVLVTVTSYENVTGLVFYAINIPAIWNFFNSSSTLPITKIGLKSADLKFITTKWDGHFNLANITLWENPHVTGQMIWPSDTPDGKVSGMASRINPDGFWTGPEIGAGQGNCYLLDPDNVDGRGGTPGNVEMYVADGFNPYIDAAYTHCHVRARIIGGAQTVTLNIHKSSGGPGDSFNLSIPDTGHFSSTPYTAAWIDLDFNISSMGLTTADQLFTVAFTGHIYIFEYSFYLY